MAPGDNVRVSTPGGGGYGDPARRYPEAVRRDVALGYYGADEARARRVAAAAHVTTRSASVRLGSSSPCETKCRTIGSADLPWVEATHLSAGRRGVRRRARCRTEVVCIRSFSAAGLDPFGRYGASRSSACLAEWRVRHRYRCLAPKGCFCQACGPAAFAGRFQAPPRIARTGIARTRRPRSCARAAQEALRNSRQP